MIATGAGSASQRAIGTGVMGGTIGRPRLNAPLTSNMAIRLKRLPLAAALAGALLCGCSMIPAYERPDAPVSPAFPGGDASTAGIAAAELQWQAFF